MARLLQEGKSYQGVDAATAIKKYNGGGAYSAQSLGLNPNQSFQEQIKDPQRLQKLVQDMAKAEGYKGKGTTTGQSNDVVSQSFSSIAPRLSADARKSAQATINGYIKNGDTEGAKQFIISTAIGSLPVEQQNKAFGRQQAIDSLNNIESLLSQYKAKGGNTNLLSGTDEQIRQKLGQTSNPELAKIGNQIALSLVAYRQSVSGAAFTESEAKFYEQLFPSTKNSNALNQAKIESLRDAFNLNQKSSLKTVLGDRNYDGLIGGNHFDSYATNVSQQSAESAYAAQILNSKPAATTPRGNSAPQTPAPSAPSNVKKAAAVVGNAVDTSLKSNAVTYVPYQAAKTTVAAIRKFLGF